MHTSLSGLKLIKMEEVTMIRPDDTAARKRPSAPARLPFNFSRYLPYHLTFPVGTISRILGGAMESRFGLKTAHWRIVALLGSHGPVSTRELSKYLSSEKSAVSRATTELIARGYVLRVVHPVDRRLIVLHFSASGKRLFERMTAVALDFEAALLADVSAEEIALLDRTLKKLSDAAIKYRAERGRLNRRVALAGSSPVRAVERYPNNPDTTPHPGNGGLRSSLQSARRRAAAAPGVPKEPFRSKS
jgi:DNA-binding MarR family transcriptional regulator